MPYSRSGLDRMYLGCGWVTSDPPLPTHLALFHGHGLATWCAFLVDAGQEVLRDPQGILKEGMVWVTGRRVL